MKAKISAKGYTNVILVLNMKRFVAPEDQERFESIRGTSQFAEVLRHGLWDGVKKKSTFVNVAEEKRQCEGVDHMSTEQIGFATGVFRTVFLKEHVVPTYLLNKELVEFPFELQNNFQFRALFLRAWKAWKIYIRPTMTGMLIIRLTREYNSPRELIKLAGDVLRLHESLDVQSARIWLAKKSEELKDKPADLEKAEQSVAAFLAWLGSEPADQGELLYNPVQWKIAMEVASLFVEEVGSIHIVGSDPIHLSEPMPQLYIPLHDSYVIFHIDELYADESIVKKGSKPTATDAQSNTALSKEKKPVRQILVPPDDLHRSPLIKRAIINLLEAAILERETASKVNALSFPTQRWQNIDRVMENNLASWMDEICLMTSRTALIMPSRKNKRDNLLVSTTPGATLKVRYARYWGAIERMVEFAVEIRTLAQLVERASYESLEEIAGNVHTARETLQAGDIQLDCVLPQYVKSAGNLRRLAALSQGMSDPLVWSRGEHSVLKARYLLDQLGVPILLTHIDRNISSLISMMDHIDELYALDLAEKDNDLSTVLTAGLATVSFLLTLIMLPSFWADILQVQKVAIETNSETTLVFLPMIFWIGTLLGGVLFAFSLLLGFVSLRHLPQIWKVLRRSLNRLGR